MKKLFTLLMVILTTLSVFAQTPQKMSYQAVVRNSNNVLITSSPVGMRISILQGSATGTPVYVETQTPSTNANGLVSIEIGGGSVITGTFSTITWASGPYFLKTETDPLGGTNYTISDTSQLLSVPYALYAKSANTHYIGESYGGGIVFYVYDNGQHGLIAAIADQSTGIVWTNTAFQSTVSNAVRNGINGGLANTERIVIQAGAGSYAAQLCASSQDGNYADWYLPSKYELNLLYLQKDIVGGFNNNTYWSSTEAYRSYTTTDLAWAKEFNSGPENMDPKSEAHFVRAIRAF